MHSDELFPLEAVPTRVRHALVREFKGRCPSLREVDEIPDKHWLATPGMGPTSLQTVRSITNARRKQEVSQATSHSLSDAQLLQLLGGLQEDLRWLEAQLKARMLKGVRSNWDRQWRDHTGQNQTDLPSYEFGEGDASHCQSDQGQSA